MSTRTWLLAIPLSIGLCFIPSATEAHQIKLVQQQPQRVENIEVSQAFYSKLTGETQTYTFTTEQNVPTNLQLLVPATRGARTDFVARITNSENNPIATLDGNTHAWSTFFEPYGGDTYLQGPDYEKILPADTYTVTITNTDNRGAYVLVYGKKEEFPPSEIIRTLALLPTIKEDYFEKTWMEAVFNRAFVMTTAVLIFLGILVMILQRAVHHFHQTKKNIPHHTLRIRPRLFEESLETLKKKKRKSRK